MKKRSIDLRSKPPVKGIDLWQAMNFIWLDDVSVDFITNCYTSATTCYVPGSRPVLEKVAKRLCHGVSSPLNRVARLANYVAEEVPWAGYYERDHGSRLPSDRNFTEEQILRSRAGWCMEQARLLCALTQIRGIPSRLVFAGNRAWTYGHVVTEVLLKNGWMLIDQSFGHCFIYKGRPASAWEVYHAPKKAGYFAPIYRSMCRELDETLGNGILSRDFEMAVVANPLNGFARLGYCNHFV